MTNSLNLGINLKHSWTPRAPFLGACSSCSSSFMTHSDPVLLYYTANTCLPSYVLYWICESSKSGMGLIHFWFPVSDVTARKCLDKCWKYRRVLEDWVSSWLVPFLTHSLNIHAVVSTVPRNSMSRSPATSTFLNLVLTAQSSSIQHKRSLTPWSASSFLFQDTKPSLFSSCLTGYSFVSLLLTLFLIADL